MALFLPCSDDTASSSSQHQQERHDRHRHHGLTLTIVMGSRRFTVSSMILCQSCLSVSLSMESWNDMEDFFEYSFFGLWTLIIGGPLVVRRKKKNAFVIRLKKCIHAASRE
jgi:hypothetical protein